MRALSLPLFFLAVLIVACGDDSDAGEPSGDAGPGGDAGAPTDAAQSDAGQDAGGSDVPRVDASAAMPTCTTTTSELGWGAGDDVTESFAELMATQEDGDVVCFDAMYEMRAAATLVPEGVTLYASAGSGLRAIDVAESRGAYLELASRVTLHNFTITDEGPLTPDDNREPNNKTILIASDAEDITLLNCLIEGHAKTLFRVNDVDRLSILGTHFRLSYYQILMTAGSDDLLVEGSYFSESQRDGIKTQRGPGGVERPRVINSAFEDQTDGIDTTGGFGNSVIQGCLFRDLFAGLDIKAIFEREADLDLGVAYSNIRIEDSQFINSNSGVVLTTIDRGEQNGLGPLLNDANAAPRMPHDIELENVIIEEGIQGLLIKDAHDVHWNNVQILGDVNEARIFAPRDFPNRPADETRPQVNETNYNLEGTNVTSGPPRGAVQPYPFEQVGPR